MRQMIAFTKKEFMESWRTSRFMILMIVFGLFGIMNPAIAKLTPWIMETYSETLKETGMIVQEVTVDAMSSWTQFYKNVPMGLIVFLLLFSGIMANEYQKRTLVNMITKGLSRKYIVLSKTLVMLVLWTISYWMCYLITYVYNEYFWDNSVAKHIFFGALCIYLLGIWLIAALIFMSTLFKTVSGVCVGTGGVFFISYILSIIPDATRYLPTKLIESSNLLMGNGAPLDYKFAIVVSMVMAVGFIGFGIMIFNKKEI